MEHVNLGQYLASNVFSLMEFKKKMGGKDEDGTLGALFYALAHLLRYVGTGVQQAELFAGAKSIGT